MSIQLLPSLSQKPTCTETKLRNPRVDGVSEGEEGGCSSIRELHTQRLASPCSLTAFCGTFPRVETSSPPMKTNRWPSSAASCRGHTTPSRSPPPLCSRNWMQPFLLQPPRVHSQQRSQRNPLWHSCPSLCVCVCSAT